jgi:hypothetical protein
MVTAFVSVLFFLGPALAAHEARRSAAEQGGRRTWVLGERLDRADLDVRELVNIRLHSRLVPTHEDLRHGIDLVVVGSRWETRPVGKVRF